MLEKINPILFLFFYIIGLYAVSLLGPKITYVVKYPSVNDGTVFRNNDTCYQYKFEKIPCNESCASFSDLFSNSNS